MSKDELGKIFADGEVIFREGDPATTMFVIQEGKVRITRKGTLKEVTIATLVNGDIFGEMAIFDKLPRSATATSYGKSRILSIDKAKTFASINRDPTLAFKLLESMSKRIRAINENLSSLNIINKDFAHILIGVGETSRIILDEAKALIKAERGSIMVLDDEGSALEIKAAFGRESNKKIKLAVGVGIAGDVMKTGKAELVNNVSIDSRFQRGESEIRSILCVPLKIGAQAFGVINMSNSGEHLFTVEDLKMLHSLSVYAAVAIQSAKNFAAMKSAADKLLTNATLYG